MVKNNKKTIRRKLTHETSFIVKGNLSKRGISRHYLYYVWLSFKRRCYNPKDVGYKNYGGRGIIVCSEWKNSVETFFKWGIENGYSKGLSLDRIDNNKGYSPENCRFTNRFVQQRNRRVCEMVEHNGISRTLTEWAAVLDIPYSKFYSMIKGQGLSINQSIDRYFSPIDVKINLNKSKEISESIKNVLKSEGRTMVWVINKLNQKGAKMSSPKFSNIMKGRDCFTESEVRLISAILGVSNIASPINFKKKVLSVRISSKDERKRDCDKRCKIHKEEKRAG